MGAVPKIIEDPKLILLWNQIEDHICDPEFNSIRLSELAAMSRTNLYRKLISKTGMSATAFIRYVRLTKASQLLLKDSDLTISEVAFNVGFNSLSYFTRRFTQLFGVCPKFYKSTTENSA